LPRIEAGLRDGSLAERAESGEEVKEFLTEEEASRLPALLELKRCRYLERGRDDHCHAGYDMENSAVVPVATTAHLCRSCGLPDDRVVCSMLQHVTTWHAPGKIRVTGTKCAAGMQESPDAVECAPGKNECWHRIVEPEPREETVHLSPLTLHEALGYLDAVWRDVFDKKPLLSGALLTAGGMLATPCRSAKDFDEKVKGLVDTFDAFQIPDGGTGGGTLDRMLGFLEQWADSKGSANDELPSVARGMAVLKAVARVRAYFQHSDARARGSFEAAQRALGIRLPAISYAEEWDRLVSGVTEAIRIVREFLRKHAPQPAAQPRP
jgi:hypothetical protein